VKTRSWRSWHDLLAMLVLIVAASLAWSKRIGGGDTFVSLAAGRDTLAGKMGLPDEWSFTTEGRVWLDQNWGSHTTYYVSYWLLGDAGPVTVKWLVIFGVMLLMVRAATERGATRYFAAVIVAVTILVARSYLDVRPHIFTLLFEAALIVVCFRWYKSSAAWAFVATAILGLWTNMHGGFIFGLGVMGMWLGVQGLFKLVWPSSRPWGWSHLFVYGAALGVAVLLAAFANPFGRVNLTHPLVAGKSRVWMSVQEWHPVLDWPALVSKLEFKEAHGFGSVTEFLVLMGVLAVTLLGWTLTRLIRLPADDRSPRKGDDHGKRRDGRHHRRPKTHASDARPADTDWLVRAGLFDFGLMVVVIAMAFKARRFIPLATVATVPIMVAMLEDMLRRLKRVITGRPQTVWTPPWQWGLAGVNVILLAVGLMNARKHIYIPYHDPNPVYPKQSVLMRMVGSQTFPKGAMDFLTAQDDLPPEAFVDWRWEGYTRWRTDRLKTFCGGRAQQVHSERIAEWQISSPSQGVTKYLHVVPAKGTVAINNTKLITVISPSKGLVAEIGAGRVPLAQIAAAITINKDGQTVRHEADRTVSWRFVDRTEIWVDVEVIVERTTEPKFRAEYALSVLADQKWVSHGSGFCKIQLKRLVNTGSAGYHVVGHNLLMRQISRGPQRPVGRSPITFWQRKDLRFGLGVSRSVGGMVPRVDPSDKAGLLESGGRVARTLNPNDEFVPKRAGTLAFVHRVQGKHPPAATLNVLHYVEVRQNCRRAVEQADAYGIKIFVLPKRSAWRLGWTLLGSKRWVCVFDDGAACVLLRRDDPRNERIINKILSGEASYPDEQTKALGTALTRRGLAPADNDIRELQRELMAAVKLQPYYPAHIWLLRIQGEYPLLGRPEHFKKHLAFWLEQWESLSSGPVDPQRAVKVYESRRIVAQMLRDSYHRMGRKAEADHWNKEFQRAHGEVGRLHSIYQ